MSPVAPRFGMSGATSRRRSRAGGNLPHRDGFVKTLYYLREDGSLSESQETITAWGIQGSGLNPLARPLESATLTETEEVVIHDTWTGVQPAVGTNPDKLVGTDAMLIISAERRLTISGEGTLPSGYEPSKVGSQVTGLTIQSAIGSATVSLTDGMLVSVSDDSNLTDWRKWTLEMMEFISPAEGEDGTRHLITATLPGDLLAGFYTITKTTSLGREAWVTVEVSTEEHFGTAAANDWPTA